MPILCPPPPPPYKPARNLSLGTARPGRPSLRAAKPAGLRLLPQLLLAGALAGGLAADALGNDHWCEGDIPGTPLSVSGGEVTLSSQVDIQNLRITNDHATRTSGALFLSILASETRLSEGGLRGYHLLDVDHHPNGNGLWQLRWISNREPAELAAGQRTIITLTGGDLRVPPAGTYYLYALVYEWNSSRPNNGANCFAASVEFDRQVTFPLGGARVTVTAGDDHGDARSGATRIGPNSDTAGRLEREGDLDYFRFELPSRAAVTVETTGDTDTLGRLENASGDAIATDDDGGVGINFRIRRTLDAGAYYARVTGFSSSIGPYTLRVRHTPEDGGDGGGAGDEAEQRYSLPLLLSASNPVRQGFVRVINRSNRRGAVRIHAIDDAGMRKAPIELDLDAGAVVHFNSDDLEAGNRSKGLFGGVGVGVGDWRLDLITALDIEPLAYVRTSDGFLTGMRGTAARLRDGRYQIPFFNPASNVGQVSSLRLVNPRDGDAEVTISGLDDRGMAPPSGDVRLTLRPRESRTVTAQELESGGAGLRGRFGDGSGKWRLFVSASKPIEAISLLESPTGNLANLSVRGRTGWLPLVPPASNREQQGFVRVVNHSRQSGVVRIRAIDDAGRERGPITLSLDARATAHFNSGDLETGNAAKGLSGGLGSGRGNWRLELESSLNIEALAYIRTRDGFVTSVYGLAEEVDGAVRIPFLNPASNTNQASRLRLINRGGDAAAVTISGLDDRGSAPSGQVRLTLRAGESRTIRVPELESGGAGLSGRLGDGAGKWRLSIQADRPILAMSLLESRTGNLTNLSAAGGGAVGSVSDGGGSGSDFVEDQLEDFDIAIPGSCAREVDVCVRDHQCEDGDEVRVTVNGEVVFSGELFNAPDCVTVPVTAGRNTIELYALNGTGFKGDYCSHIDVNTGQIDVIGGNEQTQTWLHRGGAGSSANLNVTIGPDGPCRPGPGDGGDPGDGNDTRAGATGVAPGVAADGTLDAPDDVDYWRIDIPSRGRVVIESTGSTDTLGRLEDASGRQLAENDEGGAGLNFKIERVLDAGTYYVRVSGSGGATGAYGLRVSHTPDDTGGGGGQVGEKFRDCAECPEMVVVPAGTFLMGAPESEARSGVIERPVHRVSVPSFAAGVYEVTFAEWDACVAAGGCGGYRPDDRRWGRGRHPVFYVSWEDAQLYVEWLSGRTGRRYRLLSESEWEYAARAGTTGPFHTGSTISSDQANYIGSVSYPSGDRVPDGLYRQRTLPVGSFPANGFGLHDVHGNVWEWVQDCFAFSYQGAPSDGSAWEHRTCPNNRVWRGGDLSSHPWLLRSANRNGNYQGYRYLYSGFRVARTL